MKQRADRILKKLNDLESWIDESKGNSSQLPLRLMGYAVLLAALILSNLWALVLWPFSSRRSEIQSFDAPQDVDGTGLDELLAKDMPVLIDFWAPWCGPCVLMTKTLERFAAEKAGTLVIAKVNASRDAGVSERFGVRGLPTLILMVENQEIARHAGALSKTELSDFVAKSLSSGDLQ